MQLKKSLKDWVLVLLIITYVVGIGILLAKKSINNQEALAIADAESIAKIKQREEENTKRRENILKKAPLRDKYIEQFMEREGISIATEEHIEVINKIYPYLDYIEIGDRIQLLFTPEADAKLTDSDLEKIWGNELPGFDNYVYENTIIEDYDDYENHDDYREYDDNDVGSGNNSPGYHTVEGYFRTNSNGTSTYVDDYNRSNPDENLYNNLSP